MHSREAWFVQGCGCILGATEPDQPVPKSGKSTKSSACRHDFVATTATLLFPNFSNFNNHESIPCPQESFAQFIKAYPSYSHTLPIDQIRARHYSHLSFSHHVCLDYIGVGLFSHSQLPPDFPDILSITFKPVSLKSQLHHGGHGSDLESAIKKRVMDFFNVSQNEYSMVFTANRSAAFRLVAESYPYQTNRKLLTVYDHESEAVGTMVSSSEKRGAHVMAAEFKWPRLRIHSPTLRKMIKGKNNKKKKQRGLFVFPLQSRTSGAIYSYQWMNLAQEHGWHVLLDACALGPKHMDTFGLSLFRPDFLICSFYKVYGQNPTGFGCLFVKKSVVPVLEALAGADSGIVSIITPKDIDSGLIDQSECKCLDQVDSLGLRVISSRGRYLINWLVTALMKLQHPNRLDNLPLVMVYGPRVKFERGPALAFNIYNWKGEMVEPALVQKLADRNYISLGLGFLHNILFPEEEKKRSGGRIAVVTAALTFLANFEDVYRLWAFVAQFLDADFVEKERWRYTALNQNTVEVL